MLTRSAKGAETRSRLSRAAADLFHKQGVRGTSPEDVIEASGTGKDQPFYHYFKSKEALVHEVPPGATRSHQDGDRAYQLRGRLLA